MSRLFAAYSLLIKDDASLRRLDDRNDEFQARSKKRFNKVSSIPTFLLKYSVLKIRVFSLDDFIDFSHIFPTQKLSDYFEIRDSRGTLLRRWKLYADIKKRTTYFFDIQNENNSRECDCLARARARFHFHSTHNKVQQDALTRMDRLTRRLVDAARY